MTQAQAPERVREIVAAPHYQAGPLGTRKRDAELVRSALQDLGWTGDRLAQEAKLSPSMVSLFLAGKRKLSWSAHDRVMVALAAGALESGAADLRSYFHKLGAIPKEDIDALSDAEVAKLGANVLNRINTDLEPPKKRKPYEAWRQRQMDIRERAHRAEAAEAEVAQLLQVKTKYEEVLGLAAEKLEQVSAERDALQKLVATQDELITALKGRIRELEGK